MSNSALLAYVARMSVQITLPDDLAERIDHESTTNDDVARINEVADELNREAEDVLEYQVIS